MGKEITMKKAVIFDMDGVLSDSEWIYVDKILEVLREEDVCIDAEKINDLFGQSMIFLCEELKNRYQLKKSASCYAERIHALRDRYIKEHGLFPMEGAVSLLKKLHEMGIPVAVASSAPVETIRSNMERFGMNSYIDHMVSGLSCKRGKPDPEIYRKAAFLLKTDPAQCVVIEDSANGVAAAKAAGMYCIAFIPEKAVAQDLSKADEILTTFVGLEPDRILSLKRP